MVDFKKKLGKSTIEKKINPIDIYNALDRKSEAGDLRPAQSYILSEWFNKRESQKDVIIKLHTGEGKTLIGLLILQSKLNYNHLPSIYICPNIYLMDQVMLEAKKFGIHYCTIGPDNILPKDFMEGKKILITYVQKVFNGKTIFGLDNNSIEIGNIVIDDSHACIESIKDAFTIKFNSDHPIYEYVKNIFEEDIKNQGEGSFYEIESGEFNTMLPVPYWAWLDKKSDILEKLSAHRDEDEVKFSWFFFKDNIENFQAFISGTDLEISPYFIPIHHFAFFHKASHRILMSATTHDDSFFVKGLGFAPDSIKNPLTNPSRKWSSEKMILIPSLIHESLDRDLIINIFAKPNEKLNFGIVFLTNSFHRSNYHKSLGAIVAKPRDIFQRITDLKKGKYSIPLVIANRYDGIDLPDETCRILIIDSKPIFNSLSDKYEETCRLNSAMINVKTAQRIEQGIGRSVRGEKDYSVIIIIGDDLVRFLRSSKSHKYFSDQTKKQVDVGLEIANLSQEDISEGKDPKKVLIDLINQSLKRDEGWKAFYTEEMNSIEEEKKSCSFLDILYVEHKAEEAYYNKEYDDASDIMQQLIDGKIEDPLEKGWYLQSLARYNFYQKRSESNKIQKSAFIKNRQMLKPERGFIYKKLEFIDDNRIQRLKSWINNFSSYEDLTVTLNGIMSDLNFGVDSDKFEKSLQEVGEMLGFLSERPDKEYKKGPDNLWCGVDNHYFVFECKSEVSDTRKEIKESEAVQMSKYCAWFESEYSKIPVNYFLIIPTKTLSANAFFTHKVAIIRKKKLSTLKANIKSFFLEFKNYKIHDISDEKIQGFINGHKLDIESLKSEYSESYFQKTS
jgi:replicative superfamily II helicase